MSITHHSNVCQSCTGLHQRIEDLLCQIEKLEQQVSMLGERLEQVVGEYDLVCRTLPNNNMSFGYRCLFIALNQTYPCLVDGTSTQVSVWEVRKAAGWASKDGATKFFRDMQSIGVFTYESGQYDKKEQERSGYLTPNPDVFPYPETFDTRSCENRKKERKAAQDRRDLALEALKRFNCENCGSMQLGYIAKCESCGHIHTQDLPIPVAQIEVKPAEGNGDIDWDKEIAAYEGAA